MLVCDVAPGLRDSLSETAPLQVDRMARVAAAHDRALASLPTEVPVVPLPVGTILRDDATARALLDRLAPTILAELEWFRDHAEWAVTVQLPVLSAHLPSETHRDSAVYLRRREHELEVRRARTEARADLAAEVHGRLGAHAAETEIVEPLRGGIAATRPHHGVYLVASERTRMFVEEVAGLRAIHPDAVIEISGPWPPYHFTTVRLDGAGPGLAV